LLLPDTRTAVRPWICDFTFGNSSRMSLVIFFREVLGQAPGGRVIFLAEPCCRPPARPSRNSKILSDRFRRTALDRIRVLDRRRLCNSSSVTRRRAHPWSCSRSTVAPAEVIPAGPPRDGTWVEARFESSMASNSLTDVERDFTAHRFECPPGPARADAHTGSWRNVSAASYACSGPFGNQDSWSGPPGGPSSSSSPDPVAAAAAHHQDGHRPSRTSFAKPTRAVASDRGPARKAVIPGPTGTAPPRRSAPGDRDQGCSGSRLAQMSRDGDGVGFGPAHRRNSSSIAAVAVERERLVDRPRHVLPWLTLSECREGSPGWAVG